MLDEQRSGAVMHPVRWGSVEVVNPFYKSGGY